MAKYHWFTSSYANWNADDSLRKCILRQRATDKDSLLPPAGFNIWKVPGVAKETNYKIRNYEPLAEGAECIGSEQH